ncbi:MAG: glycosyltransferase family 39 protein [Magnetococcales bacterium]|nr:glycosyltransferase family 39 protein [Magnetococcales bacterium]
MTGSTQDVVTHRWGMLLLVVVLGMLWFAWPGYRDLNEPDEGRYAEIPREMAVTGDWLTPRLDGFKYFEKPPLQYWATAGLYRVLGTSVATSRLWCILMGFVGILWVIRVGGILFGPAAGGYAGLSLASMLLYVAMGHFNTLDMGVAVCLMGGMGALLLAQSCRATDPRACRHYMLLGWAALAGACLSKGMIGLLLPSASLLLYTLWQRDWTLWRHLHLGWGLLLFLALTVPWFWGVSLVNPEFPHFFFIHEHLERYTSTVHGRTGVWWYFLGVLLLGSIPWTHRALVVLFRPGFARRGEKGGFDPVRLLWVYIVFTLFFFSISQSKLIPYILPLLPPLAILLGRHLAREVHGLVRVGWETRILAIVALLLVVGGIHVDLFADDRHPVEMLLHIRPWLLGAASVLAVAVGISLWRHCRGQTALITLVTATLLAFQCLSWGAHAFSPSNSSQEAAQAIASVGDATTPVYAVNCYFQSLPFYLNRTVVLVQFKGELEFGIQQEPGRWLADPVLFRQRWLQESQAVAIFRRDDLKMWRATGLPMRVLHEDQRRVVVARR